MQAHFLDISGCFQPCFPSSCRRRLAVLPSLTLLQIPRRLRGLSPSMTQSPCRSTALLPVFYSLKGGVEESSTGSEVVKVKFMLQRRCEFGQYFSIAGSHELLGFWNPQSAKPMEWSDGHKWTAELGILVGEYVEFKAILSDDGGLLEWQPGSNSVLKVSKTSSNLEIEVIWANEDSSQNSALDRNMNISASDEMSACQLVERIGSLSGEENNEAAIQEIFEEKEVSLTLSEDVNKEGISNALVSTETSEDLPIAKQPDKYVTSEAFEVPGIEVSEQQELDSIFAVETEIPLHLLASESISDEQCDSLLKNDIEVEPQDIKQIIRSSTDSNSVLENGVATDSLTASEDLLLDLMGDKETFNITAPVSAECETEDGKGTIEMASDTSQNMEGKPAAFELDIEWGKKVWSRFLDAFSQNRGTLE